VPLFQRLAEFHAAKSGMSPSQAQAIDIVVVDGQRGGKHRELDQASSVTGANIVNSENRHAPPAALVAWNPDSDPDLALPVRHRLTKGDRMANSDFAAQLQGYSLTTAEILYRMPDHPTLIQSFVWQDYDLHPRFPKSGNSLSSGRATWRASCSRCVSPMRS
jgi:hypothetical protein